MLEPTFLVITRIFARGLNVVAGQLVPVEHLLRAFNALFLIVCAPDGRFTFANLLGGCGVSDPASVTVVVDVGSSTATGDPAPSADTSFWGAGRHILGNLENSKALPWTLVMDREHNKIFRGHILQIGVIGNCKGAARNCFEINSMPI